MRQASVSVNIHPPTTNARSTTKANSKLTLQLNYLHEINQILEKIRDITTLGNFIEE